MAEADPRLEAAKPIPNLPGYFATLTGEIIGRKGGVLKTKSDRKGYRYFGIRQGSGKSKNISVARAVCSAFNGPADGRDTDHINGIRHDDRPTNLQWLTRADNLARRQIARGSGSGTAKLTESAVAEIRASPETSTVLAVRFSVSPRTIRDARSGKLWRHVHA